MEEKDNALDEMPKGSKAWKKACQNIYMANDKVFLTKFSKLHSIALVTLLRGKTFNMPRKQGAGFSPLNKNQASENDQ